MAKFCCVRQNVEVGPNSFTSNLRAYFVEWIFYSKKYDMAWLELNVLGAAKMKKPILLLGIDVRYIYI